MAIRGGHGIAIGSEQSGGVENISFRDCQLTNTLYGLELKAQNDRGGYIRQVTITDCLLDRFMAHPVAYNADGQAAQQLPIISDEYPYRRAEPFGRAKRVCR
ncbi:glycosyl hydrolase family 28 protein [Enterococcus casseliflavus]|uniref:glycosyl hydrolase family 28 protein n=1 Tax=Enterococcus casseliflavus TaxID=37734 RepID=UPI00224102A0|nr:glycosyl hydrolase family 28 protein [Enterococcus casseliflavus]